MKSVRIAALILAVCLSSAGLAVAQDDAGSGCPTEDACELWEEFKDKYGGQWSRGFEACLTI